MSLAEAIWLERHILRQKPKWGPRSHKLGNGEWVVWLNDRSKRIVWNFADWEATFVSPSVQPMEVAV